MSLIHSAILWGLGLVAIPIVLHFLLRQKPKKLLFPALRLIQVRQRNNVRRMRLRHVWLLLLRVLVIGFLVFALAQPRLPPAEYGLTLREGLTLAAIAAAAVGAYAAVARRWRQARLPHHVFAYRRSLLRGGTGIVAVMLLLLFVVWPYWRRIAAELSDPQPAAKSDTPVAAVFLFDTSASMSYRLENQTRLERAQELAAAHFDRLPPRSRVAIGDSSSDSAVVFQADVASASARIRGLSTHAASRPLDARVAASLAAQEEDRRRTLDGSPGVPDDQKQDRYLREIYVFTDMARSAWNQDGARLLRAEMERLPWAGVYLIDVGAKLPVNVGIADMKLSRQTVAEGGDLSVETALHAVGTDGAQRTVEISVVRGKDDPAANDASGLVKKGQATVTVDSRAGARVAFNLPGVKGPFIQGELRIVAGDPLSADDVRYFTAAVKPAPRILLVGESADDVLYWREALAPAELEKAGRARYRCQFLPAAKLDETEFAPFDVVCLFDVSAPTEKAWDALAKYVASGGGIAVVLGSPRIDPVAYNGAAAQSILPAKLAAHLRFRRDAFLDLQNLSHPILRRFDDLGGPGELTSTPVYRHWLVEPNENATVVASYDDDRRSPALLERPHGQGRTAMLTTAANLRGWNELPRVWQFMALADQMMQHLGRLGDGVYNYEAGDGIVLPLDRGQRVEKLLLRKPALEQSPVDIPAGATSVAVDSAGEAGQYSLTSADGAVPFSAGFSVNVPQAESDFTRIAPADLDLFLGEKRYAVAESSESLERIVSYGRIGQEMFPFVLAFLLAVFVVEHLSANWFYESEQSPAHAGDRKRLPAQGGMP